MNYDNIFLCKLILKILQLIIFKVLYSILFKLYSVIKAKLSFLSHIIADLLQF